MDWILIITEIYLCITTVYFGIFSFAGRFFKAQSYESISKDYANMPSFRILIPAYREDEVILSTIENILRQDYPSELFEVVVIADSLQTETIAILQTYPIVILPVHFTQSTKADSLRYALQELPNKYEWSIVLDADNQLEINFLKQVAGFITTNPHYKVLQAHRTAKNLNTVFARLDAISEEVNNTIFRSGHSALGLSSALIGSGMIIQSELYKKYIEQIKVVSGFDKELELVILQDKLKIAYLPDVPVYDEKVQKANVFGKQRTRWVSAQLHFAHKAWQKAIPQLFLHNNIDYFNKAIQLSLPPRLMLIGFIGILSVGSGLGWIPHFGLWSGLLLSNCIIIVCAIPAFLWNKHLLKDILYLPYVFWLMLKTLWFIKSAKNTFIHTPHTFQSKSK